MAERSQIILTAGFVTAGLIALAGLGQWHEDSVAQPMPPGYGPIAEHAPQYWEYTLKPRRRSRGRRNRLQGVLGGLAESSSRHRKFVETYPPHNQELSPDRQLHEQLSATIGSEDRVRVGLFAVDLRDGVTVAEASPDAHMIPASNQKVVTGAAALSLLGPAYSFQTRWFELDDTLYVQGEGDPTLDARRLGEVTSYLAAHRQAAGAGPYTRVVYDDSAFGPARFAPGFGEDEVGWTYLAPSGALSLEFNVTRLTVFQLGSKTGVRATPDSTALTVLNRSKLGSSSGSLWVKRKAPTGTQTTLSVSGSLKRGRVENVRRSVAHPGAFAAGAIALQLADAFEGEAPPIESGTVPGEASPLLVDVSPPLLDIVAGMLAFSNNFVAEQLVRSLSYRLTPFPGDWDQGTEILRAYLAAIGMDPFSLEFVNGSGMNRDGRATARSFVQLLALSYAMGNADFDLHAALPVAGRDGTLRSRLSTTGGRVRGKTGTMDGVSGLSGYIDDEDGEPRLAFSVLVNAKDGEIIAADARRRIEDRIVRSLLTWIDENPRS